MSWEKRGGRGRYYTRSSRRNGRVVREYFGGGTAGELAHQIDEAARANSIALRESFAANRAAVADVGALSRAVGRAAKTAMFAAMFAAGYRLHARSTWRRIRMPKRKSKPKAEPCDADELPWLRDGDSGAGAPTTEELRRFLAGEPARPAAGDLTGQAEAAWLALIAGPDDVYRRALAAGLAGFKAGLAVDDTPAERVLVDQCGLAHLEAQYFAAKAAETAGQELSVAHRRFLLEGADRASRRLAFLVKQLASVRGLLRLAGEATGGNGAKRDDGRAKSAGRGARSGTES